MSLGSFPRILSIYSSTSTMVHKAFWQGPERDRAAYSSSLGTRKGSPQSEAPGLQIGLLLDPCTNCQPTIHVNVCLPPTSLTNSTDCLFVRLKPVPEARGHKEERRSGQNPCNENKRYA